MVTRIELKNFRNFSSLVLTPGRRLMLAGRNGKGKSTVVDALAWAITGQCRGVNAKGEGQQELIKLGEQEAEVVLDIDQVGQVRRRVARGSSASSNIPTEMILNQLGVSAAAVLVALYGRRFFAMDYKDAQRLLMGLLNVEVKAADLPGIVLPKGRTGANLDELEAFYQAAFADRAAAKKALAAIAVPMFTRSKKQDAMELPAVQAAAAAADRAYTAKVGELATLEANLKTWAGLIERGAADDMVATLKGNLTAHRDMLAEHEAAQLRAEAELAAPGGSGVDVHIMQASIANMMGLAERVAGQAGTSGCVLARNIPCLTNPEAFKGHVDQLRSEAAAMQVAVDAALAGEKDRQAVQARLADAVRNVTYHQNQVTTLEAKLASHEEAVAGLATVQKDHAAAMKKLAKLKLDTQKALTDRDTKAAAAVELREYKAACLAADAALLRQSKAKDELQRLEKLVELLGPKGIRNQVLTDAVGAFEAMVNGGLEGFGFTLSIQVEPWAIFVATPGTNGMAVRYELLSEGQKLWTGAAFQLALAKQSGLQFCAVDSVEAVVDEDRALLADLIMDAPVDQVLVGIAKAEDEEAPEIDGLEVVRLT